MNREHSRHQSSFEFSSWLPALHLAQEVEATTCVFCAVFNPSSDDDDMYWTGKEHFKTSRHLHDRAAEDVVRSVKDLPAGGYTVGKSDTDDSSCVRAKKDQAIPL